MTGSNGQGGVTSNNNDGTGGSGRGNDVATTAKSSGSTNAEISAMHDFIAGGVAGSASVIVGHPFDTIKVRMQTGSPLFSSGGGGGTPSTISPNSVLTTPTTSATATTAAASTPSSFLSANSNFSMSSLFRGMAAPLSTAAVVNAIIFSSYGYFMRVWETTFLGVSGDKQYNFHGTMTGEGAVFVERGDHGLHEYIKHQPPLPSSLSQEVGEDAKHCNVDLKFPSSGESGGAVVAPVETGAKTMSPPPQQQSDFLRVFTCGALAGTAQAFVICPMEHIKCRLQIVGSTYHGPLDACLSITRSHGIFRGLYRGMGVTLWRETPAFGMYFATYDAAKARAEHLLKGGRIYGCGDAGIGDEQRYLLPSHTHAWAASALAGGLSGAWTWAIIYPFDVIKTHIQTGSLDCQKSMWRVGHEIVRAHGIQHMFRGLGVTLARAFPVNAVIFPTYEFVLLQLGDGD